MHLFLKLNLVLIIFAYIAIKCNDELNLDNQQKVEQKPEQLQNGNIRFEIVDNGGDDSAHLFKSEDFDKIDAQLLRNPQTEPQEQLDESKPENDVKQNKTNNKKRVECTRKNYTTNIVRLVNGSALSTALSESNLTDCFVVLFYLPWCKFSAHLAPYYNALPRAFEQLDILAFDVSKSIGYNTKFGTNAVPMIIVFQHKSVISKYNHTQKNLSDLIEFVAKTTEITGNPNVTQIETDFDGPVPTVPIQTFDYALLLAWLFLIVFLINFVVKRFNVLTLIYNFYVTVLTRNEANNNNAHQHAE